ncbi:phosphate transport system substrate-binding protein [Candidatus Planktophila dulcis]|uniref:Phosphate-binding protein n=1 Tax=Candidatus Planktophila dulcis TaxID=1884914 RepID=A0AAD0E625_9ACTN|nr:substrate-binding domain-containing protein [Candidatus Planktophila dulcis]ASY12275.1 phosphate transport system substrate-binding protein [Candidatus Planktophila dulcis]ASY14847.1 phosphate transport system substrate-binding protein [Candidatus Planktophila dulcis]
MTFSKKAKALVIAGLIAISSATPAHAVDLQGSGASFVDPLLQACKAGFAKASSHSYVYTSTGSGTGQKNSDAKIGDFWFSDTPHTAATKRSTVFHAPVVAAPIAVLVNLPAKKDVYLSATTVAKIFAGEITRWNDPAIVADNNRSVASVVYKKDAQGNALKDASGNPVVLRSGTKSVIYTLPNQPIKVIFRSDGSGTSGNFTAWMNAVAPTVWSKAGNNAFTTAFPGNINATGNIGRIVGANQSQGVATLAAKTKYSITYAEKNWGDAYGLRSAYVGNASGSFTFPDSVATSAFLGEASQDANGIVKYDYNTKVAGAYTLGIISYMLIESEYADKTRGAAVKQLAEYIVSPACSGVDPKLGFVVISGTFLDKAKAQLAKMNK